MCDLPSRKKYQSFSSRNHLRGHREKYRDYGYKLCVSLDLTDGAPIYTSLKISVYRDRDANKPYKEIVIVNRELNKSRKSGIKGCLLREGLSSVDDRKHFGELLFILAAKLKYDLEKGEKKKDNCGFCIPMKSKR